MIISVGLPVLTCHHHRQHHSLIYPPVLLYSLALTVLIAFFPSFGVIVNIVGGVSVSALSFILPCLMLMQLRRCHLQAYRAQLDFLASHEGHPSSSSSSHSSSSSSSGSSSGRSGHDEHALVQKTRAGRRHSDVTTDVISGHYVSEVASSGQFPHPTALQAVGFPPIVLSAEPRGPPTSTTTAVGGQGISYSSTSLELVPPPRTHPIAHPPPHASALGTPLHASTSVAFGAAAAAAARPSSRMRGASAFHEVGTEHTPDFIVAHSHHLPVKSIGGSVTTSAGRAPTPTHAAPGEAGGGRGSVTALHLHLPHLGLHPSPAATSTPSTSAAITPVSAASHAGPPHLLHPAPHHTHGGSMTAATTSTAVTTHQTASGTPTRPSSTTQQRQVVDLDARPPPDFSDERRASVAYGIVAAAVAAAAARIASPSPYVSDVGVGGSHDSLPASHLPVTSAGVSAATTAPISTSSSAASASSAPHLHPLLHLDIPANGGLSASPAPAAPSTDSCGASATSSSHLLRPAERVDDAAAADASAGLIYFPPKSTASSGGTTAGSSPLPISPEAAALAAGQGGGKLATTAALPRSSPSPVSDNTPMEGHGSGGGGNGGFRSAVGRTMRLVFSPIAFHPFSGSLVRQDHVRTAPAAASTPPPTAPLSAASAPAGTVVDVGSSGANGGEAGPSARSAAQAVGVGASSITATTGAASDVALAALPVTGSAAALVAFNAEADPHTHDYHLYTDVSGDVTGEAVVVPHTSASKAAIEVIDKTGATPGLHARHHTAIVNSSRLQPRLP